jgi:O-methyltransferase involved in polyketide biosynthesis
MNRLYLAQILRWFYVAKRLFTAASAYYYDVIIIHPRIFIYYIQSSSSSLFLTMVVSCYSMQGTVSACCLVYLFLNSQTSAFSAESPLGREARSSANSLAGAQSKDMNRGTRYGLLNNSTIPTAQDAAARVGVRAPLDVPSKTWKRAWKIHRLAMPFLHFRDPHKPPDSSLSLMCLWWKALAANDPTSPAFDESLTYDMLPSVSRVLVGKRLRRLYPRLHHTNVEIRTAFLDQAVTKIVQQVRESGSNTQKIRLITLGGGYDARSIKFRERGLVDQAIELDLPDVVNAKRSIFGSKRLKRRRPSLTEDLLPEFYAVDLNNLEEVTSILKRIVSNDETANVNSWHTIFLFEGVMIYLNEGVPHSLIEICRRALGDDAIPNGSLVFADRLERIPGGDLAIGTKVLAEANWRVVDWQPKPGLARHMGTAEPILLP